MKKSTKVILWVFGILAVIIFPDFNMHYQNIILKLDKLPTAYRTYSALVDIKDDEYEIVNFFNAESLLELNDSTIVIITNAISQDNSDTLVGKNWYKINLEGMVTDSLNFSYPQGDDKHFYKTFNNYIVDIAANTYSTWLIDNDSTSKPIENLQPNKIYSSAEVAKMTAEDKYVHSEIIQLENGDYINKVIFYRDKSFCKI